MSTINNQLYQLYKSKWTELTECCSQLNPTNKKQSAAHPLFIKVGDEYEAAKYKVMIVGQETDGWIGNFSSNKERKCLDFILNDYYSYLYGNKELMCKEHYKKYSPSARLKKKNQRPFWNKANFKYFQDELKEKLGGSDISFIWNNVSKLGKTSRGKATDNLEEIEDSILKGLHKDEIAILKPDIIIFTSGSNRDHLIKKRFGGSFSAPTLFSQKEIAKITFDEPHSNTLAFRTFHPNARSHIKTRKSRNKAIVDEIVQYISLVHGNIKE